MEANYPEFTPPAGTIPENQTEGEATVKWQKKPDGSYCFTEFEGEPLTDEAEQSEVPSVDDTMGEATQA